MERKTEREDRKHRKLDRQTQTYMKILEMRKKDIYRKRNNRNIEHRKEIGRQTDRQRKHAKIRDK